MILYIIRHGETEWNTAKKMQGQTDIPLNDNGLSLAREVGRHMRDIPFDLVISSPLQRARVTAELITEGRDIPFRTDDRLIEMSFGAWEGRCILDPEAVPPTFNQQFHDDPWHCQKAPGGESFADVIARTRDFFEDICHTPAYQQAHILISTHGAAGRCLLSHFYEDKQDIWRGCIPKNCSVCIVEVVDGVGSVLELDKMYMMS